MKEDGYVYLVGAGPGDPGLITAKGLEILKTCDSVVYDRLASEELLHVVKADCEKINVGKRVGHHAVVQEEINRILVQEAKKGRQVVRLKGGDSFVFGRGGEEVQVLEQEGIGYELVPGVTSCISVPELAGIPVTHRGVSRSFHVVTGHTADSGNGLQEDIRMLAKLHGTLVFLMGMTNIVSIMQQLREGGKPEATPVAVISNGGTSKERIVRGTIATIVDIVRRECIEAPAVIVVGEVASYSMVCKQTKTLSGIQVGLTGTESWVKKMKERLSKEGASCHVLGTGTIERRNDAQLDNAIHQLASYGCIAFTSTNAVHRFFERMREQKKDVRALQHMKLAVIGEGTAQALETYGLYPDIMPKKYTAIDLAHVLCQTIGDERILIPRAEGGSKELNRILLEHGKSFEDLVTYELVLEFGDSTKRYKTMEHLDYLVFGSSKGVTGCLEGISKEDLEACRKLTYVCIGEVTKETLKSYVSNNTIVASTYTAEGVVNAMMEHVKGEI